MNHVKIAFVDLDGVINSVSNVREHLVPEYTDHSSYWAEWHKAHVTESINYDMVRHVADLYDTGHHVVFCSSRQDTCMASTKDQLNTAFDKIGRRIYYVCHLRSPRDDTPPPEYKEGVISTLLYGVLMGARVAISVTLIEDCADTIDFIKAKARKYENVTINGILVEKFRGAKKA